MLSRTRPVPSGFIEPCLPSPAVRPPTGPEWVHEIKHDGYRLMARRHPIGVRHADPFINFWFHKSTGVLDSTPAVPGFPRIAPYLSRAAPQPMVSPRWGGSFSAGR
jgi:hypothetical protein